MRKISLVILTSISLTSFAGTFDEIAKGVRSGVDFNVHDAFAAGKTRHDTVAEEGTLGAVLEKFLHNLKITFGDGGIDAGQVSNVIGRGSFDRLSDGAEGILKKVMDDIKAQGGGRAQASEKITELFRNFMQKQKEELLPNLEKGAEGILKQAMDDIKAQGGGRAQASEKITEMFRNFAQNQKENMLPGLERAIKVGKLDSGGLTATEYFDKFLAEKLPGMVDSYVTEKWY